MSLTDQFMTRGYYESLSYPDKLQFLKDVIGEYIDTHTNEENDRFIDMLKGCRQEVRND